MGKVTFLAAQVPIPGAGAGVTYNWSFIDPTIGQLDIGFVSVDPPGPGPVSTGLQNVATSVLPRPIFQPQLGQIARAWEPTLGFGEFIYLAIPVSTAIPLGTLVTWDVNPGALASSGTQYGASGNFNVYQAVVVPVGGTAKNSGVPVAVCIASTANNSGLGITSNTTQVQYAWFQLGGQTQVLKTNIQVAPVTSITATNGVYVSATAGRVKVINSTGQQILGARFMNAFTVTSTASAVLVYLNGRPVVEGF